MGTQGRFPRWLRTSDGDGPSCVFQPDPPLVPFLISPKTLLPGPLRPQTAPRANRALSYLHSYFLSLLLGRRALLFKYSQLWVTAGSAGPQLLARRRPRPGPRARPPARAPRRPPSARPLASLLPCAPGSFCTLSSALVTGPSTHSPSVQSTPPGPQGRAGGAGGSSLSPSGGGGAAFQGAVPSRRGTEAPVQRVSSGR